MKSTQIINDLLITFKPKVLRFAGNQFPSELWDQKSTKLKKINY